MTNQVGRFVALAAMTFALCGEAFAKDPRVGTFACLVDEAATFSPTDGTAAGWSKAPSQFILNVATCADVAAGRFSTASLEGCEGKARTMLVLRTTLEGYEDHWAPASAETPIPNSDDGDSIWGGLFDHEIFYSGRPFIPARLFFTPKLEFYFTRGDLGTNDKPGGVQFIMWSLHGRCTPFKG